jgi:pimeloyl-ACP methyl ester carboxylesterase
VLVHRAGGNQGLWEAFAIHAQQSGYLVVTMDLRGHGKSVGGSQKPLSHRHFTNDEWQDAALDIDAALRRLLALGAAPNNLFLAGEGFGANLALQYTLEHEDVQGVVLLSPGTSYYGIESAPLMEQLRTRPSLLVWCDRDEYAAASAAALQARAPGHVEVRIYPGRAHGADIFTSSPEAASQIVVWLDQMQEEPAAGRP